MASKHEVRFQEFKTELDELGLGLKRESLQREVANFLNKYKLAPKDVQITAHVEPCGYTRRPEMGDPGMLVYTVFY